MFAAEAARIGEILLARSDVSPLLNLGASTRRFREETKPHIEQRLFAPLRSAGIEVTHADLKAADGVDIVGDVLDPAVQSRMKAGGFRAVLTSNMLEHVRDRAAVARACEDIVGSGGLILATVPASFPFHADPIDTGYRPTPQALAAVFTRSRAILAEELGGLTYAQDMEARGSNVWREAGRTAVATLLAPIRPKSFLARAHRWAWYARPYRVAIALVQVA